MDISLRSPVEPNSEAMFCFMVQGDRVGKAYAYVNAPDEHAARARMVPLFPGCELIPFDVSRSAIPW